MIEQHFGRYFCTKISAPLNLGWYRCPICGHINQILASRETDFCFHCDFHARFEGWTIDGYKIGPVKKIGENESIT